MLLASFSEQMDRAPTVAGRMTLSALQAHRSAIELLPRGLGTLFRSLARGSAPPPPPVSPGTAFAGAAPATNPANVLIDSVGVMPTFTGLSAAGVDQLNLRIPVGLGTGDVPIIVTVGGTQTQANIVISLQ